MSEIAKPISAKRFRAGVLCIALFWLPLPAILAAYIASPDSVNGAGNKAFAIVVIVQSLFGLIGVILAGRPVYEVIKQSKRRDAPKQLWHLLRYGAAQEVK